MANYLNVFAGMLTFIGAAALIYGLWDPVLQFLQVFPTVLYAICGSLWMTIAVYALLFAPFTMIISDDSGR